MPVAQEKQTRRRPWVCRGLLIEAAAKVFKEKGFIQTTITDIVTEAGVSKSVFYRNFRTKEAIFSAAAVEPFASFLDDFQPKYSASFSGPWNEEKLLDLVKELIRGLDKHLRANRDVLERLTSFDIDMSNKEIALLRQRFDSFIKEMRAWGDKESAIWNTPPSLELTDRIIVCLMSGLILLDGWFLPTGKNRVNREDLIDHIARLLMYGMSGMDDRAAVHPRTADQLSRKGLDPMIASSDRSLHR